MVYSGYEQSLAWVSIPMVGVLLSLTLVILLLHGHLGLTVIIEDYLRGSWRDRAIQISVLFNVLIGVSSAAAILSLLITR